jgi:hypothetical protein
MNALLVAGIIFLILLAVVVILTPYYWCTYGGESMTLCCLPFILGAIFLALGVSFVIFGNNQEHHNLRHL